MTLYSYTNQFQEKPKFDFDEYPGCLVDKPWDWDIQQNREAVNHNMQRILSNVGLDVVQTMRSHGVFGPVPFDS